MNHHMLFRIIAFDHQVLSLKKARNHGIHLQEGKSLTLTLFKNLYVFTSKLLATSLLHDLCHSNLEKAILKGAFSGLRELLATEIPLKMMKIAFYFTFKALFVLKILKFLSLIFSHVEKRLYYKEKVNFEIYDVTIWEIQLQYTYYPVSQELKAIWSVNRI